MHYWSNTIIDIMRTEQEIHEKIEEIEENGLSRGEYSAGQKQALQWVLQDN